MKLILKTERMDIFLDTGLKEILVVQKWKFNWCLNIKGSEDVWDFQAQTDFVDKVRKMIKTVWCSRACSIIKSKGIKSDFAESCAGIVFNIRVEICPVVCCEHWRVDVWKALRSIPENIYVNWKQRYIHLDSNVTQLQVLYFPYDGRFDHLPVGDRKICQPAIAHEFGHAFGNVSCILGMTGDEYEEDNFYYNDVNSIMNIGSEVRPRHFNYLKVLLEEVQPDSVFEIRLY